MFAGTAGTLSGKINSNTLYRCTVQATRLARGVWLGWMCVVTILFNWFLSAVR